VTASVGVESRGGAGLFTAFLMQQSALRLLGFFYGVVLTSLGLL